MIEKTVPGYVNSMDVPFVNAHCYDFNLSILPGGTQKVVFIAKAVKPGDFSGDLDLYINSSGSLLTRSIRTVVQGGSSSSRASTAATAGGGSGTLINTSFQELERRFGERASLTSYQKKEEWRKYKGKTVQWRGKIENVQKAMFSENVQVYVILTEKPSQWEIESLSMHDVDGMADMMMRYAEIPNVQVTMKSSQREKAGRLRKGQMVTFRAVLDDYDVLGYHTFDLSNGEIVD